MIRLVQAPLNLLRWNFIRNLQIELQLALPAIRLHLHYLQIWCISQVLEVPENVWRLFLCHLPGKQPLFLTRKTAVQHGSKVPGCFSNWLLLASKVTHNSLKLSGDSQSRCMSLSNVILQPYQEFPIVSYHKENRFLLNLCKQPYCHENNNTYSVSKFLDGSR